MARPSEIDLLAQTAVHGLFHRPEDVLVAGAATQVAREKPGMGEPGGLPSVGLHGVGHD